MARSTFKKQCVRCGNDFWADSQYRGRKHCANCKTGRKWLRPDGYVGVTVNGRATVEHRAVWEDAHGPINDRFQSVHHKNGIRTDNRLENLELIELGAHSRMHNLASGKTVIMTAEVRAKISAARRATKGKKRKLCSIEGCGHLSRGKGYCNKHYIRFRLHGDALYAKHEKLNPRPSTFDLP